MAFSKSDHQFKESKYLSVLLSQMPIYPTDLVILAIGIVVASLGATDFVASLNHGNTLREHENGQKIPDLAHTKRLNVGIVRFAFNAAIPAQILIDAISALFPIGLIVFVVIGHEIIQR